MEKMVSGLKSQNGLLEAEEDDLNRMIQEQSQQMIEDDHKEKVALFSFNLLVELLGEGQQSIRPGAGTSTSATSSSRGQPSSREHEKTADRAAAPTLQSPGDHPHPCRRLSIQENQTQGGACEDHLPPEQQTQENQHDTHHYQCCHR
ncbi:unnamed protein product [Arctogadus glacialis]